MNVARIRQLSDGEELVLAVEDQASVLEEDPRGLSIERRSQALLHTRDAENTAGLWSSSVSTGGEQLDPGSNR